MYWTYWLCYLMVTQKIGHTCLVCGREVVVPVVNFSTNSLACNYKTTFIECVEDVYCAPMGRFLDTEIKQPTAATNLRPNKP